MQTNTTPTGVVFDPVLYSYVFFHPAMPIRPISPEPNSYSAAGIGTVAGGGAISLYVIVSPSIIDHHESIAPIIDHHESMDEK